MCRDDRWARSNALPDQRKSAFIPGQFPFRNSNLKSAIQTLVFAGRQDDSLTPSPALIRVICGWPVRRVSRFSHSTLGMN